MCIVLHVSCILCFISPLIVCSSNLSLRSARCGLPKALSTVLFSRHYFELRNKLMQKLLEHTKRKQGVHVSTVYILKLINIKSHDQNRANSYNDRCVFLCNVTFVLTYPRDMV